MHCLIRRITRKSRSGVGHAEETVEAGTVSLGRATDQHVFLPDLHVALHHAVIRATANGRFSVQARTPSGVQINGRTVQTGTVRPGDRITVGRTEIRLLKPPAGIDLALEIDEAPVREGRQLDVGGLSLRETWLRKRPWAWLLLLLVLGLGLGVPFAEIHELRLSSLPWGPTTGDATPVATTLPWSRLGGDRLWESGPMSRAHRFFGQDCGGCHEQPFRRVRDGACLECHKGQPHHADDAELLRASGLEQWRCADCHLEHTGSDGLIATAPRLCTDCHAAPGRTMPASDTRAVTGFGAGQHPQFRVRLVAPDDGGGFGWRRVRLDDSLREDNGLVFPHAAHLAAEGIEGPQGKEVLDCAGCHRPGPRDVAMQPIRFERDCQRCHRLDFEPNDPQRQLPHAEPELVLPMLEEYYARVALAGGYRNPEADPPEVVRRQRPGDDELGERPRRVALAWAERWARTVATEVFEYRTCKTCHAVERSVDAAGGWHIGAVALTQSWFPAHEFSHDPHLGTTCTECHAAETSEHASDVLMPAIETCRQCHGDADSTAQVASRCIDCHGFHAADALIMETPDVARARDTD